MKPELPPRIGISSCLLGNRVRYDGGHKRDAFLVDTFGQFVEWVPVCPEVELGLGAPRDTLRLVRSGGLTRMINEKTGEDFSRPMRTWAARRVESLSKLDLSGFVLKKGSPSCGMERVKVYSLGTGGRPSRSGRGLFAEALMARFPDLPVEEESRLQDPALRQNFVERVFACQRLRALFAGRWTIARLVEFHAAHELALCAHSPRGHARLGRLVAQAKDMKRSDVQERYRSDFMRVMAVPATRRKHASVLLRAAGYLERTVDEESRSELLAAIEDYRQGLLPLIVPLTLVRHHVRRTGEKYLCRQVYLDPHPKELMLRYHV